MTPLVRKPTTRARLEGVILGMGITVVLIWVLATIATGRWDLP